MLIHGCEAYLRYVCHILVYDLLACSSQGIDTWAYPLAIVNFALQGLMSRWFAYV
jgi:hypothetical protein